MAVYEHDADRAPDSEFEAGRLEHLVPGTRGRLLDARRTPIEIVSAAPDRGSFVLQIEAFEDRGARWELSLDEIEHLQFPRDAPSARPAVAAELHSARERFDRELVVDVDPAARERTAHAIAAERGLAQEAIARAGAGDVDLARLVTSRRGDPEVMGALERFLADRGLAELELEFTRTFVSNPSSGEIVKGHAIVLAELGLCPYRGKVPRDPELLSEPWSRDARARHLVARLGFVRALFATAGIDTVTLYRAAASDQPLAVQGPGSFVSATFAREVAEDHFAGGSSTVAAAMWRQRVGIDRLLMTFLETRAQNERFLEAEAVLIGDPANSTF